MSDDVSRRSQLPARRAKRPAGQAAPVAKPAASSQQPAPPTEPVPPVGPKSVEQRLFDEGYAFDFFQAVRVLERLAPQRQPVGYDGPAVEELVRFRSHVSLNFPPSSIFQIVKSPDGAAPSMSVPFFGLVGASGVLPRHYTELVLRLERDTRHADKQALRDWFDLFNHRLLSLFYRAWEKYRFYIPFERGSHAETPPDPFTLCLLSMCGIGTGGLRERLSVAAPADALGEPRTRPLARVPDLALLRYSGLFAHRPPNAVGLQTLLSDYFQLPVKVRQFQGEWLRIPAEDQTRLGLSAANCRLGSSAVLGERVWDVEGKIRLRLGPLDYQQFCEFLPHRAAIEERKSHFLLSHLVRLYAGPALAFDVQLTLQPSAVPRCQLGAGAPPGPRLGWNTWLANRPFTAPAADAIFPGDEAFSLDGGR